MAAITTFPYSSVCYDVYFWDYHQRDYCTLVFFSHHFSHELVPVCVAPSLAELRWDFPDKIKQITQIQSFIINVDSS